MLPNQKTQKTLKNFLTKKGIMTKVFFNPVHETLFYKKLFPQKSYLPITSNVSKRILSLPLYPKMTRKEISFVCDLILEFFKTR